ncbi:MAG: fibrobacter succinogenes major paralogous domain-containing protein [Bacteroidota bacterium]
MKNKIKICAIAIIGALLISNEGCKKKVVDPPQADSTVTDIDGNIYHYATIGSQVWMLENLKTTHYRDGSPIPNVTADSAWSYLTTGAYSDYQNNPANSAVYGRLYNGHAVFDSRNIAPVGWHVSTDAEWTTLINYLQGDSVAGGKLKETGTTHWQSPNAGATNEYGFAALPGGYRNTTWAAFDKCGKQATWFTTTVSTNSPVQVWYRSIAYDEVSVFHSDFASRTDGFSVRCVRD